MKYLITILCISIGLLMPFTVANAAERHPEMREAIRTLEAAKRHMEQADHDFHGHRKEALEACEHAIHQLRLAIGSDKR